MLIREPSRRGTLPRDVYEVGDTPRDSLAWLLAKVVYADLDLLGTRERENLKHLVRLVTVRSSKKIGITLVPTETPESSLEEIQRVVRKALEDLVSGEGFTKRLTVRLQLEIQKPRQFDQNNALILAESIEVSLVDEVLIAVWALLKEIQVTLLRRCRSAKCGRVFVGRKRQVRCEEHREPARREQIRSAQERFRSKRSAREDAG
jgi:hypothetical protein